MKTRNYIACIALMGLMFTGCQKTEFSELMEDEISQQEARQAGDIQQGFSLMDVESSTAPLDIEKLKNPILDKSGVVKEVSDGDEESDDDENTDN
ncbi:MAG: hypothetical protein RLP15_05225 [Cryomorphaceae bacterium]